MDRPSQHDCQRSLQGDFLRAHQASRDRVLKVLTNRINDNIWSTICCRRPSFVIGRN